MPRLLSTAACVLLLSLPAWAADPEIKADVVYGRRDGMALTYDVVRPAKPSGAAIMWIQSGGWYSTWTDPKVMAAAFAPYLDKGYALVVVRHASAPKYTVPDAVADVRRCVRAVRMDAKQYGIDPERLGVLGGSAGGHLALMLATTGDDGDPKATDAVLKQSSRIAAAVALYPPTDLRKWTTEPPAAIKAVPALKPPLTFDAKLEAEVSPITFVTEKTAPVLLIHGDKDELVPLEHSTNFVPLLEKAKVPVELVVIKGAAHGFDAKQNAEQVTPALMKWFDTHTKAK